MSASELSPSLEWVDSHCHLNYDYSPKNVSDIVREAHDSGIKNLVTIGTELKTLQEIAQISDHFENVYHTVGVHPHDALQLAEDPVGIATLKKAALHPKCRAIGEIGLDYHYEHSPRDVQITQCQAQLELAQELKLPIVIHSRDGEADLLPLLAEHAKRFKGQMPVGVIHCFTGTEEFARACIDLGFFISFSGILTFNKAQDLQAIAGRLPLEKLMIETDAPYLAPVPFRGKKCEPAMVLKTAEKLATVKGVSLSQVAQFTTRNSKALFQITS